MVTAQDLISQRYGEDFGSSFFWPAFWSAPKPQSLEEALSSYDNGNFDFRAVANYIRQINSGLNIPEEQLIAAIPTGAGHTGYTNGSNYQGIATSVVSNALRDMGYTDKAAYVESKLQPIVDQGNADAYNRWQATQKNNSWWARAVNFGGDIGRDLGIRPLLNTAANIAGAVGATGLERQSERLLGNLEEATEAGQRYYTEHPEAAILTAAAFAAPAVLGGAAAGSELAGAGLAAEASGAPATTALTAGELAGAGAGAGGAGEALTITPTAATGAGGVADLVPYAELQGTAAVPQTAAAKAAAFLGAPDTIIATLNNPMYAGMAQGSAINAARTAIAGGSTEDILKAAAIGGATGGVGGAVSSGIASALPTGADALPTPVANLISKGAGSVAAGITNAIATGGNVETAALNALTNTGLGSLIGYGTAQAGVPTEIRPFVNSVATSIARGVDPETAVTSALVNTAVNMTGTGLSDLASSLKGGLDFSKPDSGTITDAVAADTGREDTQITQTDDETHEDPYANWTGPSADIGEVNPVIDSGPNENMLDELAATGGAGATTDWTGPSFDFDTGVTAGGTTGTTGGTTPPSTTPPSTTPSPARSAPDLAPLLSLGLLPLLGAMGTDKFQAPSYLFTSGIFDPFAYSQYGRTMEYGENLPPPNNPWNPNYYEQSSNRNG